MGPIVTQVEHVNEVLTGLETSEPDDAAVLNRIIILRLRIWHPDTSAIGKLEFMEM